MGSYLVQQLVYGFRYPSSNEADQPYEDGPQDLWVDKFMPLEYDFWKSGVPYSEVPEDIQERYYAERRKIMETCPIDDTFGGVIDYDTGGVFFDPRNEQKEFSGFEIAEVSPITFLEEDQDVSELKAFLDEFGLIYEDGPRWWLVSYYV